MRWDLIPPFSQVNLDNSLSVDRKPLIGVDYNTEQARVSVNKLGLIPCLQIPENRSIIEKSQIGHVLTLLKLGWVDLTKLFRFISSFL